MMPAEFIQLGIEEIRRRIESKDPFQDVSHVIRRKRDRQVEYYVMKKCLVYLEAPRIAGQKTTERNLFITYRELGLWIVVEEIESGVIEVRSIGRYKYLAERDSWEEIENDAD
jgi:hypothetical protein